LTFRNITLDNTNKQGDKDALEGDDIVKFCNVLPTKWFGHAERMQNQRIPKKKLQKRGKPRKRWKDDVEERWNTTAIRYRQAFVRDPSGMEEQVLEAKVLNGLYHWKLRGTVMYCFRIRKELIHGHDILVDTI
jgi:hypothetical protein